MFDAVRIITPTQQNFSQSDPVLIRQFSKKLQTDPVFIRPKLASVLIQSWSVLISGSWVRSLRGRHGDCAFYLHASDVHQHTFSRSPVRLCVRTPAPEVGLQNLRACKTWNLSNSWATGWRMQPIWCKRQSPSTCLKMFGFYVIKCDKMRLR